MWVSPEAGSNSDSSDQEVGWSAHEADPAAVYAQLRRVADSMLRRERPGQTLQPTALVHEAWLRVGRAGEAGSNGRRQFFAAMTEAMRRILIEQARRKASAKRGGDRGREEIEVAEIPLAAPPCDVLEVDDVLRQLERSQPRLRELVNLRFFGGLTVVETAEVLGCSVSSVERDWRFVRGWLEQVLGD